MRCTSSRGCSGPRMVRRTITIGRPNDRSGTCRTTAPMPSCCLEDPGRPGLADAVGNPSLQLSRPSINGRSCTSAATRAHIPSPVSGDRKFSHLTAFALAGFSFHGPAAVFRQLCRRVATELPSFVTLPGNQFHPAASLCRRGCCTSVRPHSASLPVLQALCHQAPPWRCLSGLPLPSAPRFPQRLFQPPPLPVWVTPFCISAQRRPPQKTCRQYREILA